MGVGPCQTSKGTGRSDDDAMPEISSGPGSSYSFSGVRCQPEEKNERTREVRVVISGDRIDHVESSESGGSVKADQLPREKLWSAIESASSCSGQAVEDIELSHWIQCTSVPQETRIACAVMVNLNCHPGLSTGAEQPSRAKATSRFGRR